MIDQRENILERLKTLSAATTGITTCLRNDVEIAEDRRPVMVLNDGDEQADESDKVQHGLYPRVVMMLPEIYIFAAGKPADVGSNLNTFRRLLMAAVLSDATLAGMSVNGKGVKYHGAGAVFSNGRRLEGALSVRFGVSYIMRPSDLT